MVFDADEASRYDRWYLSKEGQYADDREKELFLKLVQPKLGQTLLEVGCGTGHNLVFFSSLGLGVTGVDSSGAMLEIASRKLGGTGGLFLGSADKLSFDDNSFDIVALITLLEFLPRPEQALKEALRVAREKVYIGVLGKTSILGLIRKVKGRFRQTIYNKARFYTVCEIERMLSKPHEASFVWGGVLFFPPGWHRYCHRADRLLSFKKNPFCGFLGFCLAKGG